MEEYFNKNLIMTEEEQNIFQKSNNCWICKDVLVTMKIKLEIIVM